MGKSIYRLVRSYGSYDQKKKWRTLDGKVDLDHFEAKVYDFFAKAEQEAEDIMSLPVEFETLVSKSIKPSSTRARRYLKERGITDEDITYWKIGHCVSGEYENRIVVPSFNMEGRVNYFVARSYNDAWKKYTNPPVKKNNMIFNHLYLDFDKDLIITEGVFDAITAGKNSVPILGSSLRRNSKLFKEIVKNDTPVYIALDQDAEKKAHQLISDLMEYGIEIYKVDISPYSDVSEMGRKAFLDRKKEAGLLSSENYLLYKILQSF